jgi:glutamine---fructose-6-phosphate transaminase (isomerizing)
MVCEDLWGGLRAEGKLKNLELKLAHEPLSGAIEIDHTTHGRPLENNAHPHVTWQLAVVHNGIIENFREFYHEFDI